MPASSAASDDRLAVDHEGLSGVDRQRRGAGVPHRLHRGHADDRHVEPHVLFRLGHLDDADARAGQMPGAANHFVGPFHRLDGNDRLMLHRDRLADIERRYRVRHAIAELEILLLLPGGRSPGQHAGLVRGAAQ